MTDRSQHPIAHFVGSIPLPDSETVFRTLSKAVGPHLVRLPDGETGIRKTWIRFLQDVRREFQVEVEHDHIVVRVTRTSYAAYYYRMDNATGLVARNLPLRDDHRAPMSRLELSNALGSSPKPKRNSSIGFRNPLSVMSVPSGCHRRSPRTALAGHGRALC